VHRMRPFKSEHERVPCEQASIPVDAELNAYTVGKDASMGAHSETLLPLTRPFKRAGAASFASVVPLKDIDRLELQLFRDYFDSFDQAREGVFVNRAR
jgi:hypothetical protein